MADMTDKIGILKELERRGLANDPRLQELKRRLIPSYEPEPITPKTRTFGTALKENLTDPIQIAKNTPGIGVITSSGEAIQATQAKNRLDTIPGNYEIEESQPSTYTGPTPSMPIRVKHTRASDQKIVDTFIQNQTAESTGPATTVDIVAQIPGYAAEFAATGGMGTAVRQSIVKGGTKYILGRMKGGIARTLAKRTINAAGWVGAGVVQGTLMPQRTAETFLQNEASQAVGLSKKSSPAKNLLRSYVDTVIQAGSERAGADLFKLPGAGKFVSETLNKLPFAGKVMPKIAAAWAKATGNPVSAFMGRVAQKGGFDGVLEEVGEERLATILSATINDQDFGAGQKLGREANWKERLEEGLTQDLERLPAEFAAFSVVPGGRAAVGAIANRIASKPGQVVPQEEQTPTIPLTPDQAKAAVDNRIRNILAAGQLGADVTRQAGQVADAEAGVQGRYGNVNDILSNLKESLKNTPEGQMLQNLQDAGAAPEVITKAYTEEAFQAAMARKQAKDLEELKAQELLAKGAENAQPEQIAAQPDADVSQPGGTQAVTEVRTQTGGPESSQGIPVGGSESRAVSGEEIDPLFNEAVKIVQDFDKNSVSLLQRKLNIGYIRASRLSDRIKQTIDTKGTKNEPTVQQEEMRPEEGRQGRTEVLAETTASEPLQQEGAAKPEAAPVTSEIDKEKLQRTKQMLEDLIANAKSDGRKPNQAWLDRLTQVTDQLEGTTDNSEFIASNQVFGHPLATGSSEYQALIPIKVRKGTDISSFISKAQKMLDALQTKIAKQDAIVKGRVKATPSQIKEAKKYVKSMQQTEDETFRDLLRQETLPELYRLEKAKIEKFGTNFSSPSSEAAAKPEAAPVTKEPWGVDEISNFMDDSKFHDVILKKSRSISANKDSLKLYDTSTGKVLDTVIKQQGETPYETAKRLLDKNQVMGLGDSVNTERFRQVNPDTAVKQGYVYISRDAKGNIDVGKSGVIYKGTKGRYYIGGSDAIKAKMTITPKGKVEVVSPEKFSELSKSDFSSPSSDSGAAPMSPQSLPQDQLAVDKAAALAAVREQATKPVSEQVPDSRLRVVNREAPDKPVDPKKYFSYEVIDDEGNSDFVETQGRAVKIPGYEQIDAFSNKLKAGGWAVTEGKSGMALGKGKTQKAAMEKALYNLGRAKTPIDELIQKAVAAQGMSPRYGGKAITQTKETVASTKEAETKPVEDVPIWGKGVQQWQMTQDEWLKFSSKEGETGYTTSGQPFKYPALSADAKERLLRTHKANVKQAIANKWPVPDRVLAEYPDLTQKPEVAQKAETKPVEESHAQPSWEQAFNDQYDFEHFYEGGDTDLSQRELRVLWEDFKEYSKEHYKEEKDIFKHFSAWEDIVDEEGLLNEKLTDKDRADIVAEKSFKAKEDAAGQSLIDFVNKVDVDGNKVMWGDEVLHEYRPGYSPTNKDLETLHDVLKMQVKRAAAEKADRTGDLFAEKPKKEPEINTYDENIRAFEKMARNEGIITKENEEKYKKLAKGAAKLDGNSTVSLENVAEAISWLKGDSWVQDDWDRKGTSKERKTSGPGSPIYERGAAVYKSAGLPVPETKPIKQAWEMTQKEWFALSETQMDEFLKPTGKVPDDLETEGYSSTGSKKLFYSPSTKESFTQRGTSGTSGAWYSSSPILRNIGHETLVKEARDAGKPVPAEVLAEYGLEAAPAKTENTKPAEESKSKEELYQEGVQEADALTGDKHGFTEVATGINKILQSLGRGRQKAVDITKYWHNELVGFHNNPDTPIEKIIGAMDAGLAGIPDTIERDYRFQENRSPIGMALSSTIDDARSAKTGKPGDESFDRRVNALIDSNIKDKYPKVRRNTKQYKELHDSVLDKARGIIREEMQDKSERLSQEILSSVNRSIKEETEKRDLLNFFESKALDVLALKPDSTRAQQVLGVVNSKRGRFNANIEKLNAIKDEFSTPKETVRDKNTVFTEEAKNAALDRQKTKAEARRKSRGKGKASGQAQIFTPEDIKDAITIMGYYAEKGIRTAADFTAKAIEVFGEPIRQHIPAIWTEVKATLGITEPTPPSTTPPAPVRPSSMTPPASTPPAPEGPTKRTVVPPAEGGTSLQNAAVAEQRAATGLPPLREEDPYKDEEVLQHARDILAKDPRKTERLITELTGHIRPVSVDEEALLLHRMVQLENERDLLAAQKLAAVKSGNQEDQALINNAIIATMEAYQELTDITKAVGRDIARALRFRQRFVDNTYTLLKMEYQISAAVGRALNPAEMKRITDLQDQLSKANAELKAALTSEEETKRRLAEVEAQKFLAEERAKKAESDRRSKAPSRPRPPQKKAEDFGKSNKIVTYERHVQNRERFKALVSGELRSGFDPRLLEIAVEEGVYFLEAMTRVAGRKAVEYADWAARMTAELGDGVIPLLKDAWAGANAQVREEERTELIDELQDVYEGESEKKDAEIGRLIKKIAANHIASGITELNPLIDATLADVADIIPEMTWEDVLNTFADYGRYRPLDKNALKAEIRDKRRQALQLSKLLALYKKQPLQKTGLERGTPSDVERELIKLVNEAKKEFGIETTDPETQLKSALDAVKTRLRNEIYDLEKQITTREKMIRERAPLKYDAEATRLKTIRDGLKATYDQIFADPQADAAKKLAMATANAEKSLAYYTDLLKRRSIEVKAKNTGPTSPELERIRQRRNMIRREVIKLRNAAKPKKSIEERVLERYAKREAEYKRRMTAGDYAPRPRKAPFMSQRTLTAAAKVERIKREFDEWAYDEIMKNKPLVEKAVSFMANIGNVLKSLQYGGEVSSIGRQLFLGAPVEWAVYADAVKDTLRAWKDPNYAKEVEAFVETHPFFRAANVWANIQFTTAGIPGKNEFLPSKLPEKLPVIGQLYRRGDAAFNAPLNKQRLGLFEVLTKEYVREGKLTPDFYMSPTEEDVRVMKRLGGWINDLTGRSAVGKSNAMRQAFTFLNYIGGAPRYTLAKLKLTASGFGVLRSVLPGIERTKDANGKERLRLVGNFDRILLGRSAKALMKFAAFNIMVATAAYLVNPDDNEFIFDPRSSDFMKVRVGNQRYDFTVGIGAILRLFTQLTTGERRDAAGRIQEADRKYLLEQFIKSKESPLLRMVTMLYTGEDFVGQPISKTKAITDSLLMLFLNDAWDSYKNSGLLAGLTALGAGAIGVGVQSYPETASTSVKKTQDDLAQAAYGKNWMDLSDIQQRDLRQGSAVLKDLELKKQQERQLEPYEYKQDVKEFEAGQRIYKSLSPENQKKLLDLGIKSINIGRGIGLDGFILNDARFKAYEDEVIQVFKGQDLRWLTQKGVEDRVNKIREIARRNLLQKIRQGQL